MKFKDCIWVSASALGFLLSTSLAMAWGERGHHVICEVATQLVSEPGIREFMDRRSEMMGHVCNIPDIAWKSLGDVSQKYGDPGHFLNWEKFGVPIGQIPLNYREAYTLLLRQNPKAGEQEGGTSWWRADQFFRRAVRDGERAKASPFPEQADAQNVTPKVPYNYSVNWMLNDMGLMGHFIGDAAQPYHNTSDYDGYAHGHGGIHTFYETIAVDRMSLMLVPRVFQRGQAMVKSGAISGLGKNLLERMRGLSAISAAEVAKVEALDKIQQPSSETKGADGKTLRQFAKRASPDQAATTFEDLITTEMARAAVLLALSWEEAYIAAGRPDLSKYRSYAYPLDPKFVVPDYLVH